MPHVSNNRGCFVLDTLADGLLLIRIRCPFRDIASRTTTNRPGHVYRSLLCTLPKDSSGGWRLEATLCVFLFQVSRANSISGSCYSSDSQANPHTGALHSHHTTVDRRRLALPVQACQGALLKLAWFPTDTGRTGPGSDDHIPPLYKHLSCKAPFVPSTLAKNVPFVWVKPWRCSPTMVRSYIRPVCPLPIPRFFLLCPFFDSWRSRGCSEPEDATPWSGVPVTTPHRH